MNFNKFFVKAKEAGIEPFELRYSSDSTLETKVYIDQVERYQASHESSLVGRGLYEGKSGAFYSDRVDTKVADTMIQSIKTDAVFGHEGNKDFFIKPGLKYKKVKCFSKEIENLKSEDIISLAQSISKEIRSRDKRITVTEVSVEKISSSEIMQNSNGLKLKSKTNYVMASAFAKLEVGKEVESAFEYEIICDLKKFNIGAFASKVVKKAVEQIGAEPVKSGKYNVVFSPDCASLFLAVILGQLSSYDVREHLSQFEGKLGQKVMSSKLTVKEDPWAKNPFASSFDDEGMPTIKKNLIEKGKVATYLYDLEQAAKDHKQSTGNGYLSSGNIKPGTSFMTVKKGKKSFDEVIKYVGNGIFINDLEGVGTGLDPQSGNYSLQANGMLIEDGKITKPVTLITVAGNIMADLGKIICIGSDSALTYYQVESPSIAIRRLAISGK